MQQRSRSIIKKSYTSEGTIAGTILHVNGRFPQKGFMCSKLGGRAIYTMKGSGKVSTKQGDKGLLAGKVTFVEPGECFYAKGQFSLYLIDVE